MRGIGRSFDFFVLDVFKLHVVGGRFGVDCVFEYEGLSGCGYTG
jgi:hypothetical protein